MRRFYLLLIVLSISSEIFAQSSKKNDAGGPVNHLAFSVYKDVMPPRQNFMFSPLSIYSALQMLAEGSAGNTKEQFLQLLGTNTGSDNVYRRLLRPQTDNALKLFNSAWYNEQLGLNEKYFDTLKKKFGADIFPYSVQETGQVNKAANEWVSSKTNNRITELPVPVTPASMVTLLNVAYFLSEWNVAFKEKDTHQRYFTSIGRVKQKTDFMYKQGSMSYFEDDYLQAVVLPYKDDEYSMLLIVPRQKQELSDIENKMDTARLNAILASVSYQSVKLYLPKFRIESELHLSQSPVISHIFQGGADFSIIDPQNRAIGSDIMHKTFIETDEKKTEAAALNEVVIIGYGGRNVQSPPLKIVDANRPFIFFIMDNSSDAVAFMGRYVNAQKKL